MAAKLTTEQVADLARLEGIVRDGIQKFVAVGNALMEIRDRRLYRDRCSTFEAYVQIAFGWSRAHAYRHIEAAKTVDLLAAVSPTGDIEPDSERVIRPLTELPPEQQAEAWEEAKEAARAEGKKKPTVHHTSAAVASRRKEKKAERRAPELRNAEASEPAIGSSADTPEVGAPTGARSEGDESGAVTPRLTSPESDVVLEAPAEPALPQSDHPLVPPDSTSAVRVGGAVKVALLCLPVLPTNPTTDDLLDLTDDDEVQLTGLSRWAQQMIAARRRVLSQKSEAA